MGHYYRLHPGGTSRGGHRPPRSVPAAGLPRWSMWCTGTTGSG